MDTASQIAIIIALLGWVGAAIKRWLDANAKYSLALQLIAGEISTCRDRMRQILANRTQWPSYRLPTENKDACWQQLFELSEGNISELRDLFGEINSVYYEFNLINRRLDEGLINPAIQVNLIRDGIPSLINAIDQRSEELRLRLLAKAGN